MRIGFALPQMGSIAGPESISKVARRAEELGYSSLWVLDRLLYPVNSRAPYPVGDGSLPHLYKRVLDPLETLTFAAARTERIGVGTSILNLPWYNPVLLARSLASLDVLSAGRLRVGFGIGWSPDEYDASGTDWSTRGKRADEYISAIKKIWTTDPVEAKGSDFVVPKSFIGLKPVQKPHPPIYMAAYTPGALSRVAREANGWFPVGVPLAAVGQMFDGIKEMAKSAGRDPKTIELVIRANVEFTAPPSSSARPDELVIDVQFSPEIKTVEDVLRRMQELYRMAG
jgi:probable F420-dependent oxidoreductase